MSNLIMPSPFICLGKYFHTFFQKKILDLNNAIGGFDSPLPFNGKFECSVHIFIIHRFVSFLVNESITIERIHFLVGINSSFPKKNKMKIREWDFNFDMTCSFEVP